MRVFKTGATRSSDSGKNEYYGYRHPLVEKSFGDYMKKHQVQEDGKERKANNWWGGWDKEVSLQSMIRHLEDLTAIQAGYEVWKVYNKKGEEKTIYNLAGKTFNLESGSKAIHISEEDCCNAIRFNSGAYLLEALKEKLAWQEYKSF